MRVLRAFALVGALLAATMRLTADDGVTDIRPNGSSSFTISVPGSYRLVTDVTMTTNNNCIFSAIADVTIDLNGHTITGSGAGSGTGVAVGARGVIRNGKVRSFGGDGVRALTASRVEDVTVEGCLGDGIDVGSQTMIRRATSKGNALNGIRSGEYILIEDCIVLANNSNGQGGIGAGISTLADSIIRRCIVSDNVPVAPINGYGITTSSGSYIIDNVCQGNNGNIAHGIFVDDAPSGPAYIMGNNCSNNRGVVHAYGILALDAATIIKNVCNDNDSTSSGDAFGIKAGDGCLILDNQCRSNNEGPNTNKTAYGIYSGVHCRIEGNVCNDNSPQIGDVTGSGRGIQAGDGSMVKRNLCQNNDGEGTGNRGVGIEVDNAVMIIGNHLANHTGGNGATGYGIYVAASGNNIAQNSTEFNSSAAINLFGTGNYCELNRMAEAGFSSTLINSIDDNVAGGDLENVGF